MEENKSAFASEQVAPRELTELEKVQQRIANYQIGIAPQSASAVNTLLELHLKSGLIKLEELEAVIAVRNEVQTGLTNYNNSVEHAQKQIVQLQEQDRLAKEAAIESEKAQLTDKIRDQRKQRKDAELKVAQLEAILASHGINMDLNNDGVIGVKQGALNQDGFVELSAEEAASLAQEHGVTIPETKIQKGKQGNPKATSKAFQMARLLNPEEPVEQSEPSVAEVKPITQNVELQTRIEETKEAISEWEDQTETEVEDEEMVFGNESTEEDGFDLPIEDETITIELQVPEDAKGIEAFLEEVDRVESQSEEDELDQVAQDLIDEEQFNQSFEEPVGTVESDREVDEALEGWDANGSPVTEEPHTEVSRRERVLLDPLEASQRSDELRVAEEDTKTEPTYAKPSAVPITSTNMPRKTLTSGDSVEAEVKEQKINTYDSEEEMLEAVQQKIDNAVEQEEEFEELVIPSADELRGMTKKKIQETAENLNFEVSTKDTKEDMIESIAEQTETLIQSLQESDEFVSATETVKDEDDNVDRRDGGYF